MKLHEYNEMMSYVLRRPMSMGGLSFRDQGFEPLPITERNKIKRRFPNKKLDFKKYRFGMPKSDPDYETARYVGKRYEQRKERTIRESKDPIKVEQKKATAKKYYSREKENILEKLKKKYEVSDEYRKQVAAQNKKTQAKIVLEKGIFPPGQKPQDNIWHDLYRSSQAAGGENRFVLDKKFIDNVPRKADGTPRWAKDNYYRTIKFKDTKTGKTINYEGVKKYLNETFGKGTYEKALDGYKLKENLRDTRIKIRGKEQKLGTALRDAVRAQGNPNVFSALEVHHPFGIKENWWNNEVVFRDANRNLILINNKLTRAAKNIKNDADRQKLLNKFGKEVDKLPGGISLFFEGQQVGTKVPTSESVLRGAAQTVKDPALTRAINKMLTDADSKNIAKQLASFGFKCSAAEGGACDNPMNYLDDIKKQQTIAKGSGNAAANAAKKLSAGKTVLREFIGPVALGFELAAAVPITYLGYKAGLPPARIVADATYGLFGDTEKARLKKVAAEQNIDTSEIQKSLDFEKASGAMQTLAQQEGEFRGPDDEMLFPQQYEKGEEDFYKSVGAFTDEEGNISKDVYKQYGSQLQGLRDYIAKLDADTAAERASKVADIGGIADYLEPSTRMNFSEGSPKDLSRRRFIKIMAGIASLPIVGKFFPGFKAAKSAKVVKLANTSTAMPEWFPDFVDKAFARGVGKKIDADITEVEIPELPDVKLTKHDDGRVFVEGRNEYNEGYQIEYKPPGYEVIDEKTGKAVKTPGEFDAVEGRHVALGPEDYDVDPFYADDLDELTTIDVAEMEKYTTGKVTKTVKDAFNQDTGLKKGMRNYDMAVGTAENNADVLRDAGLLDEID
jgi:hypothetical protein